MTSRSLISHLFTCFAALGLLAVPIRAADTTQPAKPTLYVSGDSTANSNAPLRGWGSEIGAFFDPAKIKVVNRAIGARSARTFTTQGRWDAILKDLKPGDFVLVQFGHNDAGNYKDPKAKGRPSLPGDGEETAEALNEDGKTTETIHTFGWYLRKYAAEGKAKGATVILLSKVPHKDFKDGKVVRSDRPTFSKWAENDAKATGALYVDVNTIIADGYDRLGPDAVNPLFADARTHTSVEGAKYNAAAVVLGLKALPANPLGAYLATPGPDVPPSLTASPTTAPANGPAPHS